MNFNDKIRRKSINNIFMQYLIGANPLNWWKLLFDNKFHIKWWYIPKVLFVSILVLVSSPFMLLEKLLFTKKIQNTRIELDPVFIIGHWRSGTTYLVNLLAKDKQFSFFTIIQTYAPSIFLTLKPLLEKTIKLFLPMKRPIDDMALGIDLPQEEEFAVANTIPYSILHMMAFPKNRNKYVKYGLFENPSDSWIKKWKEVYCYLLKKVTYMSGGKRLLLKSPNNTMRIKALLELFPNAKFIHIYRNPYKVCASTIRMYRIMFSVYTLQELAREEEAENFQIDLYTRFYRKFFEEKTFIKNGNLIEFKYEDFIKNPLQHLECIYSYLGLVGFEEARKGFDEYVNSQKEYKVTKNIIRKRLVRKVNKNCPDIITELGYNILK
jgi:omega-hydroxy-beta-dihydromenaquinone-9 sulfotransferase